MNRKERRAAGEFTAAQSQRVKREAERSAYHWGEVKRIKREYDRLPDAEKPAMKARLATEIDEHLAALLAN